MRTLSYIDLRMTVFFLSPKHSNRFFLYPLQYKFLYTIAQHLIETLPDTPEETTAKSQQRKQETIDNYSPPKTTKQFVQHHQLQQQLQQQQQQQQQQHQRQHQAQFPGVRSPPQMQTKDGRSSVRQELETLI